MARTVDDREDLLREVANLLCGEVRELDEHAVTCGGVRRAHPGLCGLDSPQTGLYPHLTLDQERREVLGALLVPVQ
ncbi:hypothetical protein [Brachybacterium sp. GPGPB12]|uniref:hypothetical protein n=1 Tax=Brachybacterium sp. GPGPB12 TaxID=3023517 RepID=UPI0031343D83